MEVEAKFGVPDQATFDMLVAQRGFAGLVADPAVVRHVTDRYLDTADRGFLRGGFACRLRTYADRQVVTLKALISDQPSWHSRQELEATLPQGADLAIRCWPEGDVRRLALALSQGEPLVLLVVVKQVRHQRILRDPATGQAVLELSLDRVTLEGGEASSLMELEAELLPQGHLDHLRAVVETLEHDWQLRPESQSKFDRALASTGQSVPQNLASLEVP